MNIWEFTGLENGVLEDFLKDIMSKDDASFKPVEEGEGDYLFFEKCKCIGKKIHEGDSTYIRWVLWVESDTLAVFNSKLLNSKEDIERFGELVTVSKDPSDKCMNNFLNLFKVRLLSVVNPCSMSNELLGFLKFYASCGVLSSREFKDVRVSIEQDSLVKKVLFDVFVRVVGGKKLSDTEAVVQDRWAKVIPVVLDAVVSCCKEFSDRSSGMDKDILFYASVSYFIVRFIEGLLNVVREFSLLSNVFWFVSPSDLYEIMDRINVNSIFYMDPDKDMSEDATSITVCSIPKRSFIC